MCYQKSTAEAKLGTVRNWPNLFYTGLIHYIYLARLLPFDSPQSCPARKRLQTTTHGVTIKARPSTSLFRGLPDLLTLPNLGQQGACLSDL